MLLVAFKENVVMQEKVKTIEEKKGNITIEEANIILDRIIGFVGNCDNKASIILAMYGVLFAIIFSTGAAKKLIEIASNILLFNSRVKILLFISFLVSSLAIIIGFVSIVFSLIAKINCRKYKQE